VGWLTDSKSGNKQRGNELQIGRLGVYVRMFRGTVSEKERVALVERRKSMRMLGKRADLSKKGRKGHRFTVGR